MARIAERLSRIEAATGAEDDAARWVRQWNMQCAIDSTVRPALVTWRGPGDPVWDAYAASPQGKADLEAAERYEARCRPHFEAWKTVDELKAMIRV